MNFAHIAWSDLLKDCFWF